MSEKGIPSAWRIIDYRTTRSHMLHFRERHANYHPAVLEAFYSKVPLIVLTADRPLDRIGKGEVKRQQTNFYQPHWFQCSNQ